MGDARARVVGRVNALVTIQTDGDGGGGGDDAQRELDREVTRLREHAEAMATVLMRDDLEASTRERAETAVRECEADIAWFEKAKSEPAEEEEEDEDEDEDEAKEAKEEREGGEIDGDAEGEEEEGEGEGEEEVREPMTPVRTTERESNGGRNGASTSSTPDGSSGKKKKTKHDGDRSLTKSPKRVDGPHPDAFIFDLPGDGALTLEQLSAGGHAYRARPSRKDAEEDAVARTTTASNSTWACAYVASPCAIRTSIIVFWRWRCENSSRIRRTRSGVSPRRASRRNAPPRTNAPTFPTHIPPKRLTDW